MTWLTIKLTKDELIAALLPALQKKSPGLELHPHGAIGILADGQREDEECWVPPSGAEVTIDAISEEDT